jgi:hypothetical protein
VDKKDEVLGGLAAGVGGARFDCGLVIEVDRDGTSGAREVMGKMESEDNANAMSSASKTVCPSVPRW